MITLITDLLLLPNTSPSWAISALLADGVNELCTVGLLSAHDVRFALLVFYGKHVMSSGGKFIDWMCGNYCCFWCVVRVMGALSSQIIPGPLVS